MDFSSLSPFSIQSKIQIRSLFFLWTSYRPPLQWTPLCLSMPPNDTSFWRFKHRCQVWGFRWTRWVFSWVSWPTRFCSYRGRWNARNWDKIVESLDYPLLLGSESFEPEDNDAAATAVEAAEPAGEPAVKRRRFYLLVACFIHDQWMIACLHWKRIWTERVSYYCRQITGDRVAQTVQDICWDCAIFRHHAPLLLGFEILRWCWLVLIYVVWCCLQKLSFSIHLLENLWMSTCVNTCRPY